MAGRAVGVTDEEIFQVGLGVLEGLAEIVRRNISRNSDAVLLREHHAPTWQGQVDVMALFAPLLCAPQAGATIRRYLCGLFDEQLRAERESEVWLREELGTMEGGS